MATGRSGTTVSVVSPAVNSDALREALAPVIDKDALLVTDGNISFPSCAVALGISHEALNQSSGKCVRGEFHIQNVHNRNSRLKGFIGSRRGIATKYLDSYLRWYHFIVLQKNSTSKLYLASVMGVMSVHTVNK